MFEQQLAPSGNRQIYKYGAFSIALHILLIALIAVIGGRKVAEKMHEVAVKFVAMPAPAPPPPPPASSHHAHHTHKVVPTHLKVPQHIAKPKPPEPEPEDEVEGGVVGGVKGGVAGGVVGGTLGSTVVAKNVPPFVIMRDVISQVKPRLSEVYMLEHRGHGTVMGMYKVCVGTDGRVYDVIAVKSVPGADSEIMEAVRAWIYKRQQVPVCFLYNMPITVK